MELLPSKQQLLGLTLLGIQRLSCNRLCRLLARTLFGACYLRCRLSLGLLGFTRTLCRQILLLTSPIGLWYKRASIQTSRLFQLPLGVQSLLGNPSAMLHQLDLLLGCHLPKMDIFWQALLSCLEAMLPSLTLIRSHIDITIYRFYFLIWATSGPVRGHFS